MNRLLTGLRRSEEEYVKDAGFALDFDEIAKKGAMSTEGNPDREVYASSGRAPPAATWRRVRGARRGADRDAGPRESPTRPRPTPWSSGSHHAPVNPAPLAQAPDLPELLRAPAPGGLSTFHGCGDVTRNVTACPLAERCATPADRVRPFARRAAARLGADRDLDNLPRKFKISLSGARGPARTLPQLPRAGRRPAPT
jgi:hypothetical protein